MTRRMPALLWWLALAPAAATGAAGQALIPYQASLHDKHSLQRGAQLFVNYCLSCHSARFMRYSRMAVDLEIPLDVLKRNMMFTTGKIGEPMVAVMSAEDAEMWFGIAPPDLSLVARLRGDDWLYNYFLAFYLDANSPSGWNNAIYPNTAMPHALHALQGLRRALPAESGDGGEAGAPAMRFEKI
ncbi:MAG: cytochrome c1, partial [Gammaproteobacteria bacterium]